MWSACAAAPSRSFSGAPLQNLKEQIESDFGFKILVARTEVGGYCADCQGSVAEETEALPEPAEDATPKRRRGSRSSVEAR